MPHARLYARALAELLTASGVPDAPWQIRLAKGPPAQVVSGVVQRHRINLLVMGTVARAGVGGMLIGNTAEQVLDEVRCSAMAVKPPGFASLSAT